MLRSLGVKVDKPTIMYGDNLGVIQSSTRPDSPLKKKNIAISYHKTRECVAAGIIEVRKVDTKDNLADPLTKPFGAEDTQQWIWRVYDSLNKDR